jgi:hypothetical protein
MATLYCYHTTYKSQGRSVNVVPSLRVGQQRILVLFSAWARDILIFSCVLTGYGFLPDEYWVAVTASIFSGGGGGGGEAEHSHPYIAKVNYINCGIYQNNIKKLNF